MQDDKQQSGFSHGRDIVEDALRGLAVGMRGVLEGRKMARQAKDAREQRIADEAYRQSQMQYQMRQQNLDESFRRDVQEFQEGTTERLTTLEEKKEEKILGQAEYANLMVQHKKEVLRLQGEVERLNADHQAAIAAGQAEQAATIAKDLETLKSQLRTEEMDAEYAERRAMQAEGVEQSKEMTTHKAEEDRKTQAEGGEQRIEQIREGGEQDRQTIEKQHELDEEAAVTKLQREAEARVTLGTGPLAALPEEQRTEARAWIGKVIDDLRQDEAYKMMVNANIQLAGIYATKRNDPPTAADDLALMNTFQRLIDPGVSVREADVDLIQSAMNFQAKLGIQISALTKDKRILDNTVRDDFIETARNIVAGYNEALYKGVKMDAETKLNLFPEIAGKIKFEDIVPNIFGELPGGQKGDAGTITDPPQKQLTEASRENLITKRISDSQKQLGEDPIIDDEFKGKLRRQIEMDLEKEEKRAGLSPGTLTDAYLDEIYNGVLEGLGEEADSAEEPETPDPDIPQPPKIEGDEELLEDVKLAGIEARTDGEITTEEEIREFIERRLDNYNIDIAGFDFETFIAEAIAWILDDNNIPAAKPDEE